MTKPAVDRRTFMKEVAAIGAVAGTSVRLDAVTQSAAPAPAGKPRIRFAVIGINHNHINSQVGAVLRGGGELVWLYAPEPDLVKDFLKRFPQRSSRAARTKCCRIRACSWC